MSAQPEGPSEYVMARLSRENIPFNEYRWGHVIVAVIVGIPLHLFFVLWRSVVREKPLKVDHIPQNAIVVTFHGESYITPLIPKLAKELMGRGGVWLGFHGFLSYVTSIWPYMERLGCFRFDRRKKVRPMDQVMDYLETHPHGLFFLRTDSGGPYYHVRGSVVKMALETGRPIIGMRHRASKNFIINSHRIAKPGAEIETKLTRLILPEDLRLCSPEEGRLMIQTEMDSLFPQKKIRSLKELMKSEKWVG